MRFWLPAILLGLAGGCQQDNSAIKDRIDRLQDKADTLDRKLKDMQAAGTLVAGGPAPAAAAPAPPPRPAGPDPQTTYSVPIDNDPSLGSATAKVTIVEAADFA